MKHKRLKKYGFIPEVPAPQDYVLGGLSKSSRKILRPDGDWTAYLPAPEQQANANLESMSCVSFALNNAIETLIYRKWNKKVNYSDRFLAIASGTTKQGNSPNQVCETMRKIAGAIPEEMLPFASDLQSWEDYHSPNPLNKKYYDEGRKFLGYYDMKHEWVTPVAGDLIAGLKFSPLMVSVEAWNKDGDKYVRFNKRDNHATLLVGYERNEHWLIFDSYPESDGIFFKKLDWNFGFGLAKSFSMELIKSKCFLKRLLT